MRGAKPVDLGDAPWTALLMYSKYVDGRYYLIDLELS